MLQPTKKFLFDDFGFKCWVNNNLLIDYVYIVMMYFLLVPLSCPKTCRQSIIINLFTPHKIYQFCFILNYCFQVKWLEYERIF